MLGESDGELAAGEFQSDSTFAARNVENAGGGGQLARGHEEIDVARRLSSTQNLEVTAGLSFLF